MTGTHCSPLQSRHEVEDNREEDCDEHGDWNVDEGVSCGFNEWVVHCGLFMTSENGTLGVKSRDLSHARERGKEHGAEQGF